ncbi:MAG: bacteriohemerythrin [Alphaproteobacteria bacterium]
MKTFEWSPVFEIGVPEIDRDHREMVALTNAIRDALMAEQYELSSRLIAELLAAAKAHFEREEALLAHHGFPRLQRHVRYHVGLLDKAERMKRVCENVTGKHEIRDCYDEMLSFLVDDVVRGDYDFKSFLEEKGIAKTEPRLTLKARPK